MAKHLRLFGKDKERPGTTRYVFRVQIGGGIPLQRKTQAEEEVDGK